MIVCSKNLKHKKLNTFEVYKKTYVPAACTLFLSSPSTTASAAAATPGGLVRRSLPPDLGDGLVIPTSSIHRRQRNDPQASQTSDEGR